MFLCDKTTVIKIISFINFISATHCYIDNVLSCYFAPVTFSIRAACASCASYSKQLAERMTPASQLLTKSLLSHILNDLIVGATPVVALVVHILSVVHSIHSAIRVNQNTERNDYCAKTRVFASQPPHLVDCEPLSWVYHHQFKKLKMTICLQFFRLSSSSSACFLHGWPRLFYSSFHRLHPVLMSVFHIYFSDI